jgi:pyridoxine kinase
MNVLSIQSAVTFGHVGNSAATFALQRLGHDCWPVATVQLAHHPAHGAWRGRVTPAGELSSTVEALAARGVLARADAVLSGYLADAEQGPAIEDAVAQVRRANPAALWALDPVIGDHGRIYVAPGIVEWLRDAALPRADLVTPNAFEAGVLTGRSVTEGSQALAAARDLQRRGAATVLVTGVTGASDRIEMILAAGEGAWRVETPRIDYPAHGAGDLLAALFLARVLEGQQPPEALALAASAVHGVIARSAAVPCAPPFGLDLRLVAGQDEIAAPRRRFAAARLA